MTKFIVITGGVISGLGKGIISSSIGHLLKSSGYKVTSVKIDPYINVDAGTMRPTEHGEVFVTTDGGETDQDIGTYERFLGQELLKSNNLTTGQIYLKVIEDERSLKYKGKCVEVVPHIALEIKRRILETAEKTNADFVTIEIGGTIGDYQNILFLDAVRTMKIKGHEMMFVHVAFLPIPSKLGEMKTKPLQHSVRALNASGISPDMIFCRAKVPVDDVRKEKIKMFTNVKEEMIVSAPDVDNIYELPSIYGTQGLTKKILNFFGEPESKAKVSFFEELIKETKTYHKKVKIGIIGKYFDIGAFFLSDSYLSVIESVKHACWANKVIPDIFWINSKDLEEKENYVETLKEYDGIIVPGGFGASGVKGKLIAIQYARENNIPYLGLCYGLQLALVEIARNKCKMCDANTSEIDSASSCKVIDILESQKELMANDNYGGTMRLGTYAAILDPESKVYQLYKETGRFDIDQKKLSELKKDKEQSFRLGKIKEDDLVILERHRHRYEVANNFIDRFKEQGVYFSGYHHRSDGTKLMEFIEIPDHKFFVATQAHPEFKSTIGKPAPLFWGFIKACLTDDKKNDKSLNCKMP